MSDFLRQTLHEEHQAAFRGGIIGVPLPGDNVVDRTDQNQLSAGVRNGAVDSLLLEEPDRFAATQKDAAKIDVDDPLPLRPSHLVHGRVELQRGIWDADVEPAKFLNHLAKHRHYFAFFGAIRLENTRLAAN